MSDAEKKEVKQLFGLMNQVARDIAQHMEQINQGQELFVKLFVKAQTILAEEIQ